MNITYSDIIDHCVVGCVQLACCGSSPGLWQCLFHLWLFIWRGGWLRNQLCKLGIMGCQLCVDVSQHRSDQPQIRLLLGTQFCFIFSVIKLRWSLFPSFTLSLAPFREFTGGVRLLTFGRQGKLRRKLWRLVVSFATKRRVTTRACRPRGKGDYLTVCAERENAPFMIGEAGHVTAGMALWLQNQNEVKWEATCTLPNDSQLT